jgi:hypothetical protein
MEDSFTEPNNFAKKQQNSKYFVGRVYGDQEQFYKKSRDTVPLRMKML